MYTYKHALYGVPRDNEQHRRGVHVVISGLKHVKRAYRRNSGLWGKRFLFLRCPRKTKIPSPCTTRAHTHTYVAHRKRSANFFWRNNRSAPDKTPLCTAYVYARSEPDLRCTARVRICITRHISENKTCPPCPMLSVI